MAELGAPKRMLKNDASGIVKTQSGPLAEAIRSGRVQFSQGRFSGKFNSRISKELRELGAEFDRRSGTFKLRADKVPQAIRDVIAAADARFKEKIAGIDRKLAQILPEEIADKLQVAKIFDTTLWKVDREFKESVKNITVAPDLTPERRARIADEWQNNMKLWIKDWTEQEIVKLRKNLQKSVYAGNRYESAVKTIQESYGVSLNKAKFLARQETSLLMAKFKEVRYTDSGVNEYKWGCVKMPHQKKGAPYVKGDVRYHHGILEGKIYRWDNPPVTDEKGNRNNPGQDYNCRCFAIPVVRFK